MFSPIPSRPAKPVETPLTRLAYRIEALHQTVDDWFDGSHDSITRRRLAVASALDECGRILNTHRQYGLEEYEVAKIATNLQEEFNLLKGIEANYASKEEVKSLTELRRFTIQGAYNPYTGTTIFNADGEEVTKFIPEHWQKFCYLEPSFFVDDNKEVLSNKKEMKQRAFDFISGKTGELNTSLRSRIISLFLESVENYRNKLNKNT